MAASAKRFMVEYNSYARLHAAGAETGGAQERDAATRFIKEVYPDAIVTNKRMDRGPLQVKILDEDLEEVVTVDQRQLYRKYNWPAKGAIVEALQALKADDDSGDDA